MDKKGEIGLGLVKGVLLGILVIAVIGVITFVTVTNLRDVGEDMETLSVTTVRNDTVALSSTAYTSLTNLGGLRNCKATKLSVNNITDGVTIPLANYTFDTGENGCRIIATATWTTPGSVNVSYTYTYNMPQPNEITQNLTAGTGNFFKQVPTFFTLLAVVVLILIIAIVIIAVTRFSAGGEGAGVGSLMSGGGGSRFPSDTI